MSNFSSSHQQQYFSSSSSSSSSLSFKDKNEKENEEEEEKIKYEVTPINDLFLSKHDVILIECEHPNKTKELFDFFKNKLPLLLSQHHNNDNISSSSSSSSSSTSTTTCINDEEKDEILNELNNICLKHQYDEQDLHPFQYYPYHPELLIFYYPYNRKENLIFDIFLHHMHEVRLKYLVATKISKKGKWVFQVPRTDDNSSFSIPADDQKVVLPLSSTVVMEQYNYITKHVLPKYKKEAFEYLEKNKFGAPPYDGSVDKTQKKYFACFDLNDFFEKYPHIASNLTPFVDYMPKIAIPGEFYFNVTTAELGQGENRKFYIMFDAENYLKIKSNIQQFIVQSTLNKFKEQHEEFLSSLTSFEPSNPNDMFSVPKFLSSNKNIHKLARSFSPFENFKNTPNIVNILTINGVSYGKMIDLQSSSSEESSSSEISTSKLETTINIDSELFLFMTCHKCRYDAITFQFNILKPTTTITSSSSSSSSSSITTNIDNESKKISMTYEFKSSHDIDILTEIQISKQILEFEFSKNKIECEFIRKLHSNPLVHGGGDYTVYFVEPKTQKIILSSYFLFHQLFELTQNIKYKEILDVIKQRLLYYIQFELNIKDSTMNIPNSEYEEYLHRFKILFKRDPN